MPATERGIALIVTLLAISLFSALGLGLALATSTARMADHNHEAAVWLLNAAESALELASRDLGSIPDWNQGPMDRRTPPPLMGRRAAYERSRTEGPSTSRA